MSQRVKKPGRPDESQGKRRRRRPTGSDADEDGTRSGSNSGGNGSLSGGVWTPRNLGDLKVASIYNRNSAEAPAELYRKDLISAMKLPDSEPLMPEEYWLIIDPWKQEWEKGVQVPVNPESLPESQVVVISPVADRSHDFRLPKKKYVRVTHDDFFNPDYHQLVSTAARAEKVCSYDLDDVDAAWLGCANSDRVMQILPVISEFLMEQVIEELELQCWEQVQTILKSQEGLGIEYDENVICDVCRSPESEEGNEMVFCDSCNICVHQACYGITCIPSGSFLCRTCTLGIRPSCILCPNMGGAMKATRSGHKWAHVACAIWIPEVSIGSVEKMEPITKISAIPQSRWSLICVICKEKNGACIQCSVKSCKTAYHVTCAFKNGLEMKPIIVDENAEDGIKLRSYCDKHSVNTKKDKTSHSGSEEDGEKKKSRAMTAEERNQARAEKLQQIEAEFFKYVRLKDVSQNLAVDMDIVNLIYNYWKLKRKSLNNRPLVPPRPETTQLLTQQQEQDLEQMKMFVQLRQDLERVRNLCYMVSRREKLSRSYFRLREQAFQKQVVLLSDKGIESISGPERAAILEANHGPSIYDQVYSQNGTKSVYKDFQSLITLIGGDVKPELVNGLVKTKGTKGGKGRGENPYKKTFVNGARRRSESLSSLSESEVATGKGQGSAKVKAVRKPLAYLFDTDSSMDAVIMSNSTKAKALPKKKVKKGNLSNVGVTGSSKMSTSESELDLLPTPVNKVKGKTSNAQRLGRQQPIYSDTESDNPKTTSAPKKINASLMVTKGALKEFSKKAKQNIPTLPITKSTIRVSPLLSKGEDLPVPAPPPPPPPPPPPAPPVPAAAMKKRGRIPGKKKKVDPFEATELIVPQREAAKKASESIRTVKTIKGKEFGGTGHDGGDTESPTPPTPFQGTKEVKESVEKNARRKSELARRKLSTVEAPKVNRRVTLPEIEAVAAIAAAAKAEKRGNGIGLSDLEDDGAGAVSIVPQRQAAKKAAEHIRSCQSNVVAARLIIEDEMEASRKKSKLERANSKIGKSLEKSPMRGRPPSVSLVGLVSQTPHGRDLVSTDLVVERKTSVGKVPVTKAKSPVKGNQFTHGGTKVGRKDSGIKSPVKEQSKNDWPFLDKGSQSACRRSRERSSSSSSSSSGSSSSTDSSSYSHSSSSSSRSSSPGSASPVRSKPVSPIRSPVHFPALVPLSASSVPGKKLKTSDRLPTNGRDEHGTEISRPKPLPAKIIGPPKPGPRRSTVTSLRPSSPESSNRNRATGSGLPSPGKGTGKAQQLLSTESAKTKSIEEKAFGDNISGGTKEEKSNNSTSNFVPAKRTPPKTSIIIDELALSSDSEEGEIKKDEVLVKPRGRTQSRTSSSSSVMIISPELKNRPMPKTKKRELGLLSEESEESADEKENEIKVLSPSPIPAVIGDSARKAQIPIVPATLSTPLIPLSPLAPRCTSSQKEVALVTIITLDDEEPELKKPRLNSSPTIISPTQISHVPHPLSIQVQSHSVSTALSMPKSIFSPVATLGSKPPGDPLDFDNDLYDLARSVTVDNARDAGESGKRETLSAFSFSQVSLGREDNKEESAQATINLVEKLRLQQKQKSGGTSQKAEIEEVTKEEPPLNNSGHQVPVQPLRVPQVEPVPICIEPERDENVCDLTKSPTKVTTTTARATPERPKMILEEERWLHNSFTPVHEKMGHAEPLQKEESVNRFHPENPPKQYPLLHQNFHSPQILQNSNSVMKEDGTLPGLGLMLQTGKDSIDRLLSLHQHSSMSSCHPLGLLMEAPKCQNNLVSMTAVTNSPSLPPGINLPPGLTATFTGSAVPSSQACQPAHPGFLPYPINSTLANVVTSLASGNLPFFHTQMGGGTSKLPGSSKHSVGSISTPLSSPPSVDSNSFSLGFGHHFANLGPGSMDPPLHSPNESRRRSSETSNSLAVVTSGMPPLSKPPLTSPSLLLASNNTMAAPPPPPQSTVAQIIESVIQASNNHPLNTHANNNLHQLKQPAFTPALSTNSEMNFQYRMNPYQKMLLNSPTNSGSGTNLSSNNSPLVSPTISTAKPPTSPLPTTVSDFSSILANKTNENIQSLQKSNATRDYVPVGMVQPLPVVSPKGAGTGVAGRGRRPPNPKVKDKTLVEETSPRGRVKGERKASGTSPGRGGAKGRVGSGRGRSKKNVLVRKDLAGTVYDIDFDEFEENAEDKFDLRSLRDRRKSNDINSGEFRKSESSEESPTPPRIEKNSPRQKSTSNHVENHEGIFTGSRQRSASGIQTTLQVPVDMRSYNASAIDLDLYEGGPGSIFLAEKRSSSAAEFASLIGTGTGSLSAAVMAKDFDELDKTLEALTSPKASLTITPLPSSVNHIHVVHPRSTSQNLSSLGGPGGESSLSSSKDSFTTTFSEDNHSRNQLKVKIKGPFLDANYSSSNSITQPLTYQQNSAHHHEPFGGINSTPMMNNPLNLRRMRKKELLRQYCNQDMNMDGRYTHPSGLMGEYPTHPHFHPYGRAMITIPKAVASMEIIPSGKDDYGLEPSDLCPLPTPPPMPVQEKKKRNRGVNREMAALGLIELPKGERWRDFSGIVASVDTNSRKRVRAAAKPSRSTFVPPTLAEPADSTPVAPPTVKSTMSLTAVNHPTPKLKIKFADLNCSSATCTTAGVSNSETNHIGDKDSKKAKGRPPKKRGIAEATPVPPPPPMEELKRQSLMFREKIMKDFANADDDRGKSSSGGKKKKKSKKSRRDEGMDGESSQVKIITEAGGPKLILRFGKNRTSTTTTEPLLNNNNIDGKTENGPTLLGTTSPVVDNIEKISGGGEQDSGFTGSSEGSGGSWTPSLPAKRKFSSMSGVLKTSSSSPKPNHRKSDDLSSQHTSRSPIGQPGGILKENEHGVGDSIPEGDGSTIDSAVLKFKPIGADLPSTSNSLTPITPTPPTLSKGSNDKVMPIRLKLHRCYEGYATTKEVDRENTNPKQSDSCEVR